MTRLLIGLGLLLLPWLAEAATYYVSPQGQDGQGCTQAAPCRTIGGGIRHLGSGDTLIVAGGTYPERIHDTIPSGRSNSQHTVVKAAPGQTVTLTGGGWAVQIHGKQFITMDGIGVANADIGYRIGRSSSYIVVENATIRDIRANCIGDHPNHNVNHHLTYRRLHLLRCGTCCKPGQKAAPHGIYFNVRDSIIEDSIIDGVGGGSAIKVQKDGQNWLSNNIIRNNVLRNFDFAGVFVASGSNTQVLGNRIEGGRSHNSHGVYVNLGNVRQARVMENRITGNKGACINISNGPGHVVQGNWCARNGGGILVDPREAQATVSGNHMSEPPGGPLPSVPVQPGPEPSAPPPPVVRLPAPTNLRLLMTP